MSNTTINVNINGKGTISGLDAVNKGFDSVAKKAKETQVILQRAYQINFDASKFNAVSKKAADSLNQLSRLSPQFQKVQQQAALAGKSINGSFNFTASIPGLKSFDGVLSGLGKTFNTIRNVAVGGIIGSAFIRGIGAAVDESVKLENALIGVSSIAKAFGQDTDEVKKAVLELTNDGLISVTESALAFKQILSTGAGLPETISLLKGLKDQASFNRQAFYTLGEAVVATTEGIKNGNSIRADATGNTKNLSLYEKEYAAQLGTTVDKLSQYQKAQAAIIGFTRDSGTSAGDAAKLLDTYSGSVSQLGTAFDRAISKIGDFITQSSLVKSTINGLTSVFKAIDESLSTETTERRIEKIKSQLDGFLKGVQDSPYKKRLEEELSLLEKQTAEQKKQSIAITEKAQAGLRAKSDADAVNAAIIAANKKLKSDLKKLDTKIQFGGDSDLQKLEKFYANGIKLAGNDVARRLKLDQYYESEKAKILAKASDERQEKARKDQQILNDIASGFSAGSSNAFSKNIQVPESVSAAGQKEVDKFKRNADIGRGLGVAGNITQGADGAKALVSSVAAGALDAYIPGLGEAAKPLLDAFTQGPEAVRGMVKEFAKAIPDVIAGFIEAIPAFIEEIANQLPIIIERLAEKAPEIISKLVESAPRVVLALSLAMPKVALKFAGELVKNIPKIVSEIARAVYDALRKVLSNLTGGAIGGNGDKAGGGGLKGLATTGFTKSGTLNAIANVATFGGAGVAKATYDKAKKVFGFAQGGEFSKMAVGGTPFQDSINSRLMGGELVIDRTTTSKLKKALDGDGLSGNSQLQATLNKVIELLERPMVVESNFNLNNATFAKAILNLTRTGQRLA
jgi:hypothetical protein